MNRPIPPSVTASARHRLAIRGADLSLVQEASGLIADLGAQLDRKLAKEHRPAVRMSLLRETTNRITRVANDAVQAYARTSRALRAELERPDADVAAAKAMRLRLDRARQEVLRVLEVAKRRHSASTVGDDAAGDLAPPPSAPTA